MEKRHKLPVIITFVLSGIVIILLGIYKGQNVTNNTPPIPTPLPSPSLTSVISPDMKKTLVMKEETRDNSVTHTFLSSSQSDNKQIKIFSKTVDPSVQITIPYNTWSPDDRHLFLKETKGDENSYIVLLSTGAELSKGLQQITIESLFTEKFNAYKITDVTGWAAPSIIIVNTDKNEGGIGPSFWFDVNSLSFTQLSTRFN